MLLPSPVSSMRTASQYGRRRLVILAALVVAAILLWLRQVAASSRQLTRPGARLLLGSYSSSVNRIDFRPPSSPGAVDGLLTVGGVHEVGDRPSWLCAHPNKPGLAYGVLERQGRDGGLVALSITPAGWVLPARVNVVGETSARGIDPAHCAVTQDGSHLVATNYGSGSVVFQPLDRSGLFLQSRKPSSDAFVRALPEPSPEGAFRRNAQRQASAHAHQVVVVGDDLWIVDLGGDHIWRLRKAVGEAMWTASGLNVAPLVAGEQGGEGWRHAVVGPSGRDIYVLTELTLEVLHYHLPLSQSPSLVSRTALFPARPASTPSSGAEILLLPPSKDSPFGALLASTRDSGALGNADDLILLPLTRTGALDGKGVTVLRSRAGKGLRGVGATPDGRFVFAAGQVDGSLSAWGQDASGKWREVAPPLLGLDRPTSVLVL